MVIPSQRQRDYQSTSVIRNISSRLDVASNRTGIPVKQLVAMIRQGRTSITVPVQGHDYQPFDTSMSENGGTITIQLPDLRLWDKAKENLGL